MQARLTAPLTQLLPLLHAPERAASATAGTARPAAEPQRRAARAVSAQAAAARDRSKARKRMPSRASDMQAKGRHMDGGASGADPAAQGGAPAPAAAAAAAAAAVAMPLDEDALRTCVAAAVAQSTVYPREQWQRDFLVESLLAELQEGGLPASAQAAQERVSGLVYGMLEQVDQDDIEDLCDGLMRQLEAAVEAQQAAAEAAASSSDGEGDGFGGCALCRREMPITFHHLIPKDVHAKYKRRGYSAQQLCSGIEVCRPCHSAIHRTYDNKTLAEHYPTLELLQQSEPLQRFVCWARKQKVTTRSDTSNPNFHYRR